MRSISEEARELRAIRVERDEAKRAFDELDQQYKEAMGRLFHRMNDEGVDGLKVDDVSFVPTETIYANVQDREAFVNWAKDHDDQLIEDKERKALLNQMVRERVDNGEPLPPGVGFHVREVVSQRAA